MEELLRLVGALRKRIDDHGTALRENEALTRYALVDPLLRCLGWNTEDPLQVIAEYSIPKSPAKAADYALFARDAHANSNLPNIIVEAKKLHTALDDAERQALEYCMLDGFEFFVVTDGQTWRLSETHRKGNLEAKRIVQFDLRSDPMADVCRKALALWRQGFKESVVGVAPTHHSGSNGGKSSLDPDGGVSQTKAWAGSSSSNKATSADKVGIEDWTELSSLSPQVGMKPVELKVPTGAVVAANNWRNVMIEIVKWLTTTGSLSAASQPLRVGNRYVFASLPEHPSGKPFTSPGEAGELFVETHYSAKDAMRHARSIVKHVGMDAGLFAVRVQE